MQRIYALVRCILHCNDHQGSWCHEVRLVIVVRIVIVIIIVIIIIIIVVVVVFCLVAELIIIIFGVTIGPDKNTLFIRQKKGFHPGWFDKSAQVY